MKGFLLLLIIYKAGLFVMVRKTVILLELCCFRCCFGLDVPVAFVFVFEFLVGCSFRVCSSDETLSTAVVSWVGEWLVETLAFFSRNYILFCHF